MLEGAGTSLNLDIDAEPTAVYTSDAEVHLDNAKHAEGADSAE